MSKFKRHKTKNGRIRFIVNQEKIAGNPYEWIYSADILTINELYDYWTQEL
tara:strand:+ start:1857 stop:2009 length:153 start_codon:yes stop_codon:yes gene_type:complete